MRSPLRIPQDELNQVITEAVEQYMREVNRIRRIPMRAVIIRTYQAEGLPILDEEELEAHIDLSRHQSSHTWFGCFELKR
jgi:hypothetical protein